MDMELSIKYVVTVSIVVVVLVILSFFIGTTSTTQISRSDANFVFSTKCQEYSSQGCDFSVTEEDKEFSKFISACKTLFGNGQDDVTCLYTYCPACKKIEAKDLECVMLCKLCKARGKDCCARQFYPKCGFETGLCDDVCP